MIIKCLLRENKLLWKKLLLVEILVPNNSLLYQGFSYWWMKMTTYRLLLDLFFFNSLIVLPIVCFFSESIRHLTFLLKLMNCDISPFCQFLTYNIFLYAKKSLSAHLHFDPDFLSIYFLLTLNFLPALKIVTILLGLELSENAVVLLTNISLKSFIEINAYQFCNNSKQSENKILII